jgi:predicted transposase/invertase (TIGR01784 family)
MEIKEIEHAHDLFFCESMQRKELALYIVQTFLNTVITNNIDFSSLEIEKDTWVDSVFSEHYADILYSVYLKNTSDKLYFLFEHKSTADYRTPWQVLGYQNQIWDELALQYVSRLSKLPVVIPMILYHGNKPWNVVNSTKPLFAIINGTEKYVPDFESEIIDLSILDDEKCGKSVEQSAFLLALKYSRDPRIFTKLPGIIRPFSDLGSRENQYLSEVLIYIGAVIPKNERNEFLDLIRREHRDGVSIMETVADSFREEGMQIGLEKGPEEGIKEGKLKDRFEIARRMLRKGMKVELIMELTELSSDQIEELRTKRK